MTDAANVWLSADHAKSFNRAVLTLNETTTFAQLHAAVYRATQLIVGHDLAGVSVLDANNRAVDALFSAPVHQSLELDFGTMVQDFFAMPGVGDGRYFSATGLHSMTDYQSMSAFEKSLFYQGFYRPVGVRHELSFTNPGVNGAAATLVTLTRADHAYTETERLLLELLRPHLDQRMRVLQALEPGNPHYGRKTLGAHTAALLVSATGRVESFSPDVPQRFADHGLRFCTRLPHLWRDWLAEQLARVAHAAPPLPLSVEGTRGRLLVHFFHNPGADEHRLVLESVALVGEPLTRRETEVARWLARGKTNAEIGAILGISGATVKNHVERVLYKLRVETRLAAALIVAERWPDDRG